MKEFLHKLISEIIICPADYPYLYAKDEAKKKL